MKGHHAIAAALRDAGVRAAWSFPGSPLTTLEIGLDKDTRAGFAGPTHAFVVSEHVGATMALAGALLEQHRTVFLCKHVGINVAYDSFATAGAHSLFRSGVVIIEGLDPLPRSSQNAQDNRAGLASLGNFPLLEPGDAAECYALTRYAFRLSEAMRCPVVVRVATRVLDNEEDVAVAPPDLPAGPPRLVSPGAPIVVTAATQAAHHEHRLAAHEHVYESLVHLAMADRPAGARRGVVVAGQLGRDAASGARARGLATLRLGCGYPPPIPALWEFCRGLDTVHVLEESQAFIGPWLAFVLAGFAAEGEAVPKFASDVVPGRGSVELALDDIAMRGGTGTRESGGASPLDVPGALAALPPGPALSDSAWAAAFDAARPRMLRFPERDPRRGLLAMLRIETARLGRPAIVVSDPGNTGTLGIPDGLIDVKWHMGSAAPAAAGLLAATQVGELPGHPLVIAVIGDTNYYHSEVLGILDNGIARREILHVILCNRRSEMTGGVRAPQLTDDALARHLEAAGLAVTRAQLTDEAALRAAVVAAVASTGPRALLVIDDRKDQAASDG